MSSLYPDSYTENGVRSCIESSLKRLQTEALDLIQLHCIPTKVMEKGEIFEWLRKLKTEGKIKRFGASVESMDEANMCIEHNDDLYSLQIIFNIFRQKPISTLFKKASEKNIGIIARVPLASGLLSGKFSEDTKFADNDHRHYNKDGKAFNAGETFAGLPFEKGVELAQELKSFVPDGYSMAQMALRWIIDHRDVSVVIPGASKIPQAIANPQVSDLVPLSNKLHDDLSTFYQTKVKEYIRGPY